MEPENNSSGKNNEDFPLSGYLTEMDKMIRALTLRGMAAGNEGDFDSAFINLELALWMAQSLGKRCLEATLLNNLGLIYTMQGAWDRAMLTFNRSMEIALGACPSHGHFLVTLKKNISCLFDPKLITPGDPDA
ncbi:MAG: tetratricopeptide repeat protein [Desulfobacterales bacterium]|nr:tetratricopeptide repeat protein [Desulfobacterales bacterium]